MTEAAKRLPDAELRHERAKQESAEAESAAVMVARLRSELEGLDSLRPEAAPGLRRLYDVLTPPAGYEAPFSAALCPLLLPPLPPPPVPPEPPTPTQPRTPPF